MLRIQWRDNVRKKEVLRRIATKKKLTDQKEIAEILGTYYQEERRLGEFNSFRILKARKIVTYLMNLSKWMSQQGP